MSLSASGDFQFKTTGLPADYVEPVKQAFWLALQTDEAGGITGMPTGSGNFEDLPNGISFRRGYFGTRYAQNLLNPFDSGRVTIEARPNGIAIFYRLGLMRFLVPFSFLLVLLMILSTLVPGNGIAKLIGGAVVLLALGITFLIALMRARAWLYRTACDAVAYRDRNDF